jgi:hypothetical protein
MKMNSDHLGKNAMANSKDVVVTGVSPDLFYLSCNVKVEPGKVRKFLSQFSDRLRRIPRVIANKILALIL